MERLTVQMRKPRPGGSGLWSKGSEARGPAASALGLHGVCTNPHVCSWSPGKIQGSWPPLVVKPTSESQEGLSLPVNTKPDTGHSTAAGRRSA